MNIKVLWIIFLFYFFCLLLVFFRNKALIFVKYKQAFIPSMKFDADKTHPLVSKS